MKYVQKLYRRISGFYKLILLDSTCLLIVPRYYNDKGNYQNDIYLRTFWARIGVLLFHIKKILVILL